MMGKILKRPDPTEFEVNKNGKFVRQKNRFVTPFGEGEGGLKAEEDRYSLILSKGCCWSNRLAIICELLGLNETLQIRYVSMKDDNASLGWGFYENENGRDPVLGVSYLSELYSNTEQDYKGRPTVPALADIRSKTIVNNDFHRLSNYFEVDFKPFHRINAPDLYPAEQREEIDRMNQWLFDHINNGVYKMFFAQSIEAYEEAYENFFNGLDEIEHILGNRRFLFGEYISDSDVRLYVTLTRFDCSYYRFLGPIRQRIVDYENIWGYARDLYGIKEFKQHTHFREYAKEARVEGKEFQTYNARFWDQIDFQKLWETTQNRKALSSTPEQIFAM